MKNFKHVIDGLYRGSAPTEEDVIKLNNRGITRIVSLDKKAGERISEICKKVGIEQILLPIYIFDRRSLLKLVRLNLKRLLLSKPTFVHCIHGKDRTGFIIALLKVKYLGESCDDVIKDAESFGFGTGVDPKQTKLMKDVIRSFDKDINSNDDTIVDESREDSLIINSPNMINNLNSNTWEPSRVYPYGMTYRPYTYIDAKPKTDTVSGIPEVGKIDNSYTDFGAGIMFDSSAYH
jgi:hypothetical protein